MLGLGLNIAQRQNFAGGGSLADVLSSTVFDLDATKVSSYPGSGQSWNSLAPSPGYNFNLGIDESVTATDPAFTGSVGATSAYFALDGGDVFRIPSMTTFLNNLQKTTGGTDWWIAMAFRYIANGATQNVFATRASAVTPGMVFSISSVDRLQLGMVGDVSNITTSSTAVPALITSTDYLAVGSFSAASSSFRFWVNNRTKVAPAFTPNACVSNASGIATIGGSALASPIGIMANGTRFYGVAGGNAFIDNTEAGLLFDTYNARHGRVYA